MKEKFTILQKCSLFADIKDENLTEMLKCLGAKEKHFLKNQAIFIEGTPATYLGIMLSGAAQIVIVDYYGNRSILTELEPTQIFGESYACAGAKSLPVSVIATQDSDIILIEVKRIIQSCSSACEFHRQIIFNLLKIVAQKNILFNEKIEITSKRSTREKLMAYLISQAKIQKTKSFVIPFDRQELADYLQVERSGLSAEISKLRKEGIIESKRNQFTIK